MLDTLFRCDHFGQTFAFRHCRRRQLERKVEIDRKTKATFAGLPVYPHCALACVKGREVAQELEAADVSAASCPKCGTAYVGDEADAPCAACAGARGGAPREPQMSERLWNGETPDVAIAPPRSDPPKRADPTPAPRASAEPEAPKETPMPCGNCGSKGHNRRTCPKEKPAAAAPAPAKVAKLPAAPKAVRAKPARSVADVLDVDLDAVGVEDLVALREDIDTELKSRRNRAAAELAKLNGVLGDAA
jgi:hypothetical protein